MKRWWVVLLMTLCGTRLACADASVLVPAGRQQPDAKIFSLDEMTIEIRIDNGDALVAGTAYIGTENGLVPATEENL